MLEQASLQLQLLIQFWPLHCSVVVPLGLLATPLLLVLQLPAVLSLVAVLLQVMPFDSLALEPAHTPLSTQLQGQQGALGLLP